jgi:hypothetical protein
MQFELCLQLLPIPTSVSVKAWLAVIEQILPSPSVSEGYLQWVKIEKIAKAGRNGSC